MALKDWKKEIINENKILFVRKGKKEKWLWVVKEFGEWRVQHPNYPMRGTFQYAKPLFISKTKSKALAYAKSYMRKH